MNLLPVTLTYKTPYFKPEIREGRDLSGTVYFNYAEFRSVSNDLAKHQAATIVFGRFKATIITNRQAGYDYWNHTYTVIAEPLGQDGSQPVAVTFWGNCTRRLQVIKKDKNMSWAEFCLRAYEGARAPINEKKDLYLFETSKDDGLLLAECGADFRYFMKDPQPKILARGLIYSAGLEDPRLFNVVYRNIKAVKEGGSKALVKAAAAGHLDRIRMLLIKGVPNDKDEQAIGEAQKNGHRHVLEFFQNLARLTHQ